MSVTETWSYAELLDPEVLADPYPLYENLRTTDPVHWEPYLHAWVVTRYDDVTTVLSDFSADRTPPPAYFEMLGVPEVAPIAELMVRMMLFMDPPEHLRVRREPTRLRISTCRRTLEPLYLGGVEAAALRDVLQQALELGLAMLAHRKRAPSSQRIGPSSGPAARRRASARRHAGHP